jgi:hypothetical protein
MPGDEIKGFLEKSFFKMKRPLSGSISRQPLRRFEKGREKVTLYFSGTCREKSLFFCGVCVGGRAG